MDEENFAMKLVEKQLKRSEYHFYAVCFLFFVFMLFAYLWPVASEVNTIQDVEGERNTVENKVE